MRLAGRTDVGLAAYEMAADTKRVGRFNMPIQAALAKGSAYLDGLGSGALGAQVCRMVIYDTADNLVAVSDEVTVALGQPARWVDFGFSALRGKLVLPPGDFFAGLHVGGYTNTIRVYGSGPHGMGGKWNSDTYSDGSSAVFGAATAVSSDLSLFLSYFKPYAMLRPVETDMYFARLPYAVAQSVLSLGGPSGVQRLVQVGWHDTFIDPETGSVALVRDDSVLMDLLGERVKVTTQEVPVPRSVVAYVHNVVDPRAVEWDLSLSRHLYAQLGLLGSTTITAVAEAVV